MYIKCDEIELSGEKLPYRCDNYVLEAIQEDFDTLHNFELKLMGFKENEEGKVEIGGEPSIECVNRVFPIMVEEAYRSQDKECPYTEAQIVRLIDKAPIQMAVLIQQEYRKCFETKKKEMTTKPSQRKRTAKSSS